MHASSGLETGAYDVCFTDYRHPPSEIIGNETHALLTASATEFPPPRQSAATPFFASLRIIS